MCWRFVNEAQVLQLFPKNALWFQFKPDCAHPHVSLMNHYLCELTEQCDFSISHQICPFTVGNKCLFSSVKMIYIIAACCFLWLFVCVCVCDNGDFFKNNLTQTSYSSSFDSKLGKPPFCDFTPVTNTHQVPNDVQLLYLNSYSRLKRTKGN